MNQSVSTKTSKVLRHLNAGLPITPHEAALSYGLMRLGAVIYNLKRQGHSIVSELKTDLTGTRYASYKLEGSNAVS